MSTINKLIATAAAGGLGLVALYLYTLPAMRRLPKEHERALDSVVTIDDAVMYLRVTGKTGWELVAEAQRLVNEKMAYSRRNGWDTPARAFRRGMGYCQQRAMALHAILRNLGIDTRPVHAFRCQFPFAIIHGYPTPERVSGHAWLVVTIDGVEKEVCPGHPENVPGKVHFKLLSKRRPYGRAMRIIGHIGSMVLNAKLDNAAVRSMREPATGGT